MSNGRELDTQSCTLGNSVTPTSQTFSQTDSGVFECGFSCDASGPSLVITYQ